MEINVAIMKKLPTGFSMDFLNNLCYKVDSLNTFLHKKDVNVFMTLAEITNEQMLR